MDRVGHEAHGLGSEGEAGSIDLVEGLALALSRRAQGMGRGDKGLVKHQGAVLSAVQRFKEVVPGNARSLGLYHQHERSLGAFGVDQKVIGAPATGDEAFAPGKAKAVVRRGRGDRGPGVVREGKGLAFEAGHHGLPEALLQSWAGLLQKPGAWAEGRMATLGAGRREALTHHDEGEQGLPLGALGKIKEPRGLGRCSKMLFPLRGLRHRFGFRDGPPRERIGGGEDRLFPFPQPLKGRKDGHEPRPRRAAGATVIKVRRPRPAITRTPAVRVSRSVRARSAMRA